MPAFPLDESHETLKAKLRAAFQRIARKATAAAERTKMVEVAIDEDVKKSDSKVLRTRRFKDVSS
jgi:hypothetical protein